MYTQKECIFLLYEHWPGWTENKLSGQICISKYILCGVFIRMDRGKRSQGNPSGRPVTKKGYIFKYIVCFCLFLLQGDAGILLFKFKGFSKRLFSVDVHLSSLILLVSVFSHGLGFFSWSQYILMISMFLSYFVYNQDVLFKTSYCFYCFDISSWLRQLFYSIKKSLRIS